MPSSKPSLLSGIQPTGKLHIGNYLGALKNFVELQDSGKYECRFAIVDLHSLTEDFDPKEKSGQVLDLAADFLAAGIDPKRSVLFRQSDVPWHANLAWVFMTLAPMGELERMTQFKEKSGAQKKNVNAGLFVYPVLQAADILLYKPAVVPVGEDQLQHLELTRTLARKFNQRFGKTFPEPKALLTKTPRVMSLDDPSKKMSKSRPAGCLFLDDTPEEIKKKIFRAVTDSGSEITFDEARKPAVSNLLFIFSEISGEPVPVLEKRFKGKGYAEFKSALAETVADHFAPFRKKKVALLKNPGKIGRILYEGSRKASSRAIETWFEVVKRTGLTL